MEHVAVAERAIEVWLTVQEYISGHKKLPKSKMPPSASCCTEPLMILFQAKLQCFAFVAIQLKPFWRHSTQMSQDSQWFIFFGKGAPVHPESLAVMLSQRGRNGENKDTFPAVETGPQDKVIHVSLKQLTIGFATKQALREK